jgi:hypothetical protein
MSQIVAAVPSDVKWRSHMTCHRHRFSSGVWALSRRRKSVSRCRDPVKVPVTEDRNEPVSNETSSAAFHALPLGRGADLAADVMKLILGIGVALLVALGGGWAWGASGQSDLNRALRIAELRDDLLEARAAVLDARLDIYSVNFGEATAISRWLGARCAPPMRA